MNCPFCQHSDTKVLDSRPDQNGQTIRRRRECLACDRRWRTLERLEDEMPLVLKRNGTHEPFGREKLFHSMKTACSKRPVTVGQLDQALADIEWYFLERGGTDLRSIEIGERVMSALKSLDEIAYIRYASVYRRFKDVGELMEEMRSLVDANPKSEPEISLQPENMNTPLDLFSGTMERKKVPDPNVHP
jgi:transcriptional repressor NrdR